MELIYLLSYYLFFYLPTTFYFCTLIIYLVPFVYLSTTNYFIILNGNEKKNGRIASKNPTLFQFQTKKQLACFKQILFVSATRTNYRLEKEEKQIEQER
jgi:hypothetical protein